MFINPKLAVAAVPFLLLQLQGETSGGGAEWLGTFIPIYALTGKVACCLRLLSLVQTSWIFLSRSGLIVYYSTQGSSARQSRCLSCRAAYSIGYSKSPMPAASIIQKPTTLHKPNHSNLLHYHE